MADQFFDLQFELAASHPERQRLLQLVSAEPIEKDDLKSVSLAVMHTLAPLIEVATEVSFRILAQAFESTHPLLVVGRVTSVADVLTAICKFEVNLVELRCDQLQFALLFT